MILGADVVFVLAICYCQEENLEGKIAGPDCVCFFPKSKIAGPESDFVFPKGRHFQKATLQDQSVMLCKPN